MWYILVLLCGLDAEYSLSSIEPSSKFEVLKSSPQRSLIKITIDSYFPSVISKLVAVPKNSNPSLKIISGGKCVGLKELGVMRDYQIVQLVIQPMQNELNEQEILVELEYRNGKWVSPSFAFAPIYKSLLQIPQVGLANYANDQPIPGGYLIIVPDELYTAIQPLAEWKHLKGWKVTVSKLSEVGGNPDQIKSYIQNAYNTFLPAPEYVLLVGSTDLLPTFFYPYTCTDHSYSLVDGTDYFSDVLVGRLPVASVAELQVVVNKILGYEKTPYMGETAWYKRALVVGGNYPASVTTAVLTKRWVRELLLSNGYTQVDTCFYPPTTDGRTLITQSVNTGVSFINFRGWSNTQGWHYPQFGYDDIPVLSNGWKLPIVTGISCLTGNFNSPNCFGSAWVKAGTPTTPNGGIAFYGPSSGDTHSRFNNCIDQGIYWGIFKEAIPSIGQACYRGKMELCDNFPIDTIIKNYFYYYNLIGDPELNIWTDIPEPLEVEHLTTLNIGTNDFEVTVQSKATPLQDAIVSLIKQGEVDTCGITDSDGRISLPISLATTGNLLVTVTARNHIPYLGQAITHEADTTILGPDKYGYYGYDNTDTKYTEAPIYNWIEVDAEYGGAGTIIPLNKDDTKVIYLPFGFKFYGRAYARISVCSNGWIAMDSTWMTDFYNWHIPSSMGPPTIIAPFWDNLDPFAADTGNVAYYYDVANHRFIVEWSRKYNIVEIPPSPPTPSQKQTFEVILFDPAYYPTLTGDGELIFQYHTCVNSDSGHNYCTVGIEDETHTNGLEWTFANIYPKSAATLCNGRAIKFTTDPPIAGIEEENTNTVIGDRVSVSVKTGLISYYLPSDGAIRLCVYDLAGREVKEIYNGYRDKGMHSVKAPNLASGIYFVRLEMRPLMADKVSAFANTDLSGTAKMTIIK
ncbi:MAG: hypothetical protein HY769_00595 [Candidatus Stahlbacteria bacterium]|nr:hypothetical protein [Candidatus Stahlbacteria bacterium]